jgi:hypothetical protein
VWIYIEPVCRIVCGRFARIVRRKPVNEVEGSGRNLVDVLRFRRRLVDDYGGCNQSGACGSRFAVHFGRFLSQAT